MRLFKSHSPEPSERVGFATNQMLDESRWIFDAHAVYHGGHPELLGRDADSQWRKCRISVDADELVYTNAAQNRSLRIPRSAITVADLLDGRAQPLSASRKPSRGLCAHLRVQLAGNTHDVMFAFSGIRPGPYRHAAAAFLRLFQPAIELQVVLPKRSTLTLDTPRDVAAVLSHEFYRTKFTGFDTLSLRSALLVGGQYQVLGRAYPLVEEKIGEVRVAKLKSGKRCLGTMSMGGTRPLVMSLSERFLDEDEDVTTEDRLTLDAALRFHPPECSSYASVVSHEFGHAVDDYLTKLSKNTLVSTELEKILAPKARAAFSRYATANRKEAFAEAFAMIRHTPRHQWPREAELFEKLLDRELGKAGTFTPYGALR